jgi:hypothetical protein
MSCVFSILHYLPYRGWSTLCPMRQDNDQTNNGRRDKPTTGHRYTVHEAALLMGLSVDAVRKRAERGTLKREKAPDGTVYILLDVDQPATGRSASQSTVVDSLNEQVEYLRRELEIRNDELRRKDHLLAAALERIPAIEPPETPEASESSAPASDTAAEPRSTTEEQQEQTSRPQEEQRSWWRRMFGG